MKKKVLLCNFNEVDWFSLAPYVLRNYVMKDSYIADNFDISVMDEDIYVDFEDIIQRINDHSPDIIGFSTYLWNIDLSITIAKRLCDEKDIKIIFGGPYATYAYKKILLDEKIIDCIVCGEGEETLKALLHAFSENKDYSKVPGIAFKENGKIVKTKSRELLKDLSVIDFSYQEENIIQKKHITIETARGCAKGCKHCTWQNRSYVRNHPISKVISDIKQLLQYKHLDKLYFADSDILLDQKKANMIFDTIRKYNKHKITCVFAVDGSFLTDSNLEILSQCNSVHLMFSCISGTKAAYRNVGQNLDLKKIYTNIKKFHEKCVNCESSLDMIYGLPDETNEEFIKNSFSFVFKVAQEFNSTIMILDLLGLPGSEFFENSKRYGLTFQKNSPHRVLSTNMLTEKDILDMRRLLKYIFKVGAKEFENIKKTNESFKNIKCLEIIVEFLLFSVKKMQKEENIDEKECLTAFLGNYSTKH